MVNHTDPKNNRTLRAALSYISAGLSIIPIKRDASKAPAVASWKPYTKSLPLLDEVEEWFDKPEPPGIAIIGGKVSGGLECFDFDQDAETIFPAWCELVNAEAPGLVKKLSVAQTPRPAYHVRNRCTEVAISGNTKLAMTTDGKEALIETRGEGGYAIAPGSPAECHSTGRLYKHCSGPKLSQVQTITAAEREILIRCARAFDRSPPDEANHGKHTDSGLSPGNDFNQRGPEWAAILEPHGWHCVRESGDKKFWRRPGKDSEGWSATTGLRSRTGNELLCVFSSNAHPFPGPAAGRSCSVHNKFSAFALLNHGGDFRAAAKSLAREGYGEQNKGQQTRPTSPDSLDSSDSPDGPWESPLPMMEIPKACPFPIAVFPAPLQKFAEDAATAIGCPVDCVASVMLAIAGGAAGATRALEIKPQFVQRPVLYLTLIRPPGRAKSPAIDLVALPIYEAQRRFKAEYETALEEYEKKVGEFQDAKRNRDKGKELPEKPKRPILPRVNTDDATVEAIASILDRNPRGIIMIRDELAAWVTSANQYKGGKGSDRQFWLKNWSGVSATVDRKQQEVPIIIPHPFVAVVGGIQPDLLPILRDEKGRNDGHLDRILFCFPESEPAPSWTWASVSEESLNPWRKTVEKLLNLNMEPGKHGPRPCLLRLTEDGKREWQVIYDRLVLEQNAPDFPEILSGPWSKLHVYLARLALIVHLIHWVGDNSVDNKVDGESVCRAGLLVDYFACHARKVYATLATDREMEDADRVLRWIVREKRQQFKRHEIYNDVRSKSRFPMVEDLDRPLERLAKHRYIRLRAVPEKPGAGRKADPLWEVNPLWDRQNHQTNQTNAVMSEEF